MVMNKYIPRINEYFIAAILLLLSKNRPNCAHSYNIDVLMQMSFSVSAIE